ncbi:hypothetical protein BpJC7_26980 [Weizmannia acidilactici]|uniref:Cation-transporting P-type ATPase N-terminal domain-containing protein n=2 Tax=Heyndrickxia TaxID=2837504 RepID=A0A5J4JL32_9BACI|nr:MULTISPECIES: cation-transporting P-type ATPase [Heyndrickxia]MDL5042031.1 cation-transporting P-type ATPase [Heyndrickxia coagulans]GER67115.1 hypothetical protein BpJC4_15860 [Weizmannia acidilactici]GER71395.1 hypothetical protein BpJC7_26980 [Weizmannia acidilactici]GER74769.1 hypothetical protein BpPP18_28360 [Weizmannia acidilactici]
MKTEDIVTQKAENLFKALSTTDKGLTAAEAASRLEKFSYNEIAEAKHIAFCKIYRQLPPLAGSPALVASIYPLLEACRSSDGRLFSLSS